MTAQLLMILPVVTREINALEAATIRLFETKAFKDSRVGWLLLSGISALQRDDEKLQVLRKQFKAQSEPAGLLFSGQALAGKTLDPEM